MAGKPHHDYHLVNPSFWPLIGSIAGMIFMFGMVAWGHTTETGGGIGPFRGPAVFLIGFALVTFTMIGWWVDVAKESLRGENTSPVVRIGLRYGMLLFILSEVMFFVAWFWAFFQGALFTGAADAIMLVDGTQMLNADGLPAFMQNDAKQHVIGDQWPPVGIEPLSPWQLPLINTLILLLSGTTVTWAHHALLHDDKSGFFWGMLTTVFLGAIFSVFQAVEYWEVLAFGLYSFDGNVYGGTFFMATGFHGAHVLVGTIFLIVCWARGAAGHFTSKRHFGFEAAAWYWHFVDVVWLFLFAMIYIFGNLGMFGG